MRSINAIKNLVLRKFNGDVYYFNDKGIYSKVKIEEAKKMAFSNLIFREDGTCFIDNTCFWMYIKPNQRLTTMAITKLEIGDTIEEFEEKIKSVKIKTHIKPEGLERFITKINKPIFGKYPENLNKDTFDYIYMDLCIVHEWDENRKEYIKKHIKKIEQKVLSKLEKDRKFKSYGVPLNFLKISRITLKKDDVIQFVLEMKSI